ncbi:hypothetical protein TNCV_4165141 [Trichonephila clavipes]|nr:hypothetical protein TNCV_4165141 [Trichonephila clavipes]
MPSKIATVTKTSTSTQAQLLPSTSSVMVTSPSKSQPPNSVIDTVPIASDDLSISAASSSSTACSVLETTTTTSQDTKETSKPHHVDESTMMATSSKKERRAIYSGKKSTEVPKLKELVIHKIQRNLDILKYLQDDTMCYKHIKPLLGTFPPMKLFKIEENHKFLVKYTDDLWQNHSRKGYRMNVPRPNESWRNFYLRYLRFGDFDNFKLGNCVSRGFFKKQSDMSRRKQQSAFDQVSEFDRGRIVAYQDCGLCYSLLS